MQGSLPIDSSGRLKLVPASTSVPPYTYLDSLKFDALGRVVVSG